MQHKNNKLNIKKSFKPTTNSAILNKNLCKTITTTVPKIKKKTYTLKQIQSRFKQKKKDNNNINSNIKKDNEYKNIPIENLLEEQQKLLNDIKLHIENLNLIEEIESYISEIKQHVSGQQQQQQLSDVTKQLKILLHNYLPLFPNIEVEKPKCCYQQKLVYNLENGNLTSINKNLKQIKKTLHNDLISINEDLKQIKKNDTKLEEIEIDKQLKNHHEVISNLLNDTKKNTEYINKNLLNYKEPKKKRLGFILSSIKNEKLKEINKQLKNNNKVISNLLKKTNENIKRMIDRFLKDPDDFMCDHDIGPQKTLEFILCNIHKKALYDLEPLLKKLIAQNAGFEETNYQNKVNKCKEVNKNVVALDKCKIDATTANYDNPDSKFSAFIKYPLDKNKVLGVLHEVTESNITQINNNLNIIKKLIEATTDNATVQINININDLLKKQQTCLTNLLTVCNELKKAIESNLKQENSQENSQEEDNQEEGNQDIKDIKTDNNKQEDEYLKEYYNTIESKLKQENSQKEKLETIQEEEDNKEKKSQDIKNTKSNISKFPYNLKKSNINNFPYDLNTKYDSDKKNEGSKECKLCNCLSYCNNCLSENNLTHMDYVEKYPPQS